MPDCDNCEHKTRADQLEEMLRQLARIYEISRMSQELAETMMKNQTTYAKGNYYDTTA